MLIWIVETSLVEAVKKIQKNWDYELVKRLITWQKVYKHKRTICKGFGF
jgi:N6-adenosine-specific RNA methylase IME4